MPARPLRWLALAALVAAGVSSCVRAERLDEKIARAWCDHAVECGQYPNVSTCMEVEYDEPPASYIDAAIDAGRIDYHGARAYRCVRAIKKLKCDRGEDTSEVERDCQGISEGAVGPDEPCMLSAECVGERSLCGFDPRCTEPCCPGECRFRPGPFEAGEPCASNDECVDGTLCDLDLSDPVCVALPGDGEPCYQGYACAEGTTCDDATTKCVGPAGVGEPCQGDYQCEATLFCDPNQRCATRAKEGEACDEAVGDRGCLRGDTICHEGTCRSKLAPGEACAEFTPPCVDYAYCSNDRCVEFARVGEACGGIGLDFALCYPGLFCDGNATCAKDVPPSGGEVCPVPE
ncbi:MAG: hypothetical protein KC420_01885 [Myxococcales bacterium]|nr:hypothetical protein [Myxococcales bacterium]MCB9567575.1 hypothetical protein [Myxococcales bacterium]MCB9700551.1 hypothetical protein [Myxococcales bacterium]